MIKILLIINIYLIVFCISIKISKKVIKKSKKENVFYIPLFLIGVIIVSMMMVIVTDIIINL